MNDVIVAVTAAVAVFGAATAAVVGRDGRSNPTQRRRIFTYRSDLWKKVQTTPAMYNGWYQRKLRMPKRAFDAIVGKVESRWTQVNRPLGRNTVFCIRDRVAVTLFYLTHSTGLDVAGALFGISKTRSSVYFRQVTARVF